MACEAKHPQTGDPCTWPVNPHGTHVTASGERWEDEALVAQVRASIRRPSSGKAEDRKKVRELAGSARPREVAGQEVAGQWQDDEWLAYAGSAFERFLLTRAEPFTTPEHFWPLVDRPREPRQFSQVVQRTLRAGHIEEVGAKRLRDRYSTKDGHSFAINKLVPIYRSLIYRAP